MVDTAMIDYYLLKHLDMQQDGMFAYHYFVTLNLILKFFEML